VYFDDGTLLAIANIFNNPGVSFSQGANPKDLPGGNQATPQFEVTQGFAANSDPAVQPNGVGPGEQLGILFNLQGGQTHATVIDELTDGTLRIGIHAQGFASGGSESFVNNKVPVPEPATMLISVLGLLGVGVAGRRGSKGRGQRAWSGEWRAEGVER
jgi:hypothetical protein